MEWYNEVQGFHADSWNELKIYLDDLTFNRFTPFFENQILCCDELRSEFLTFIGQNIRFLKANSDFIHGGSLMERSGGWSVGDVSIAKGTNDIINGGKTARGATDPWQTPLVSEPLKRLLRKYHLNNLRVGTRDVRCGVCPSCYDSCGCGSCGLGCS